MAEVKEEKKWMKVLKIVANVIFYGLIVLLLIFSITNLTRKDKYEVASIFGKGYCTVETSSMDGNKEDSFSIDDLIYVKKVTDKNREKRLANIKEGDIVTFKYYLESKSQYILNTHRIVNIVYDSENKIDSVITQGDKNADVYGAYDKTTDNRSHCEVIFPTEVRAIYTGQTKGLGKAMKFLQTSNGFMLCVVIPMALIFVVMLLFLVLNILNIKKAKSEEQHAAELEELKAKQEAMLAEEKERIRAELLAEQAAEKEKQEEQKQEDKQEEKAE